MYKLLISDFENTLIDEEDAIPLSTMLALDRIRTNKVAFCIITKKNFRSILDYNRDFSFMDYIIALDGTYIYDVNKDKPLFRRNINISIVKKIKKIFDEYNLCFYTLDWCNYTGDKVCRENARKIGDFKVFSDFHKDNIFKIEIHCKNKKEQNKIISKLEELNLDVNYYARNEEDYYVELIMSDCSRLQAIMRVCKSRRCGIKDSIMVGVDDDNIESFKKVGLAVAVSNASTKLKKAAKELTYTNEEKAVENIINEYFN